MQETQGGPDSVPGKNSPENCQVWPQNKITSEWPERRAHEAELLLGKQEAWVQFLESE